MIVDANDRVLQISDEGQDDRVAFGVSAMQGWRISMEDAHAAVLDLQVPGDAKDFKAAPSDDRLSFFGVYDGHGGDKVAIFAGENIHKIIAQQEAFKKGDIEQACKDGFLATDRAILNGTDIPTNILATLAEFLIQIPSTKRKCQGVLHVSGLFQKTRYT